MTSSRPPTPPSRRWQGARRRPRRGPLRRGDPREPSARARRRPGASPRARRRPRRGRRWPPPAGAGPRIRPRTRPMVPARPADAPRMPTAVRSFSTIDRVSTVLGRPATPMYTTRRPGSTRSSARAGRSAEFEASMTASQRQPGQVGGRPRAVHAELGGEVDRPPVRPRTCTSAPCASANIAASRPMVPGPRTSSRSPGRSAAPQTERRALPPGSTSAPAASSMPSGSAMQRGDRHGQLLGQRAGEAAADADLAAVLAHVVPAVPAALAPAAAEHGVAGDAPAQPARIDAVADRADRPAPLVPEPHRVRGVALLQVSHLAGEELDVGAAHADPLDVDDHLPRPRPRVLDLGDLAPARAGDHERSHAAAGGDARDRRGRRRPGHE